jgi:hypothetical protein
MKKFHYVMPPEDSKLHVISLRHAARRQQTARYSTTSCRQKPANCTLFHYVMPPEDSKLHVIPLRHAARR